MRRQFTVNEDFISYAYALFFQNPTDGGHEEDTRFPYYQVRLYSANNQVLFQKNINTGSSGFMYSPNNNILYTGWTCEKINTHEFLGQVVTLEITLSNCGNSGHIGYGYFDDFCGLSSNCIPQSVASINLHPLKETHCPSFPINVNGNYTIPIGATFNGIELDILEAGTGTLINTISVTNSLTSTNFNFLVNYNDFYPNVVITNVLFNFRVRLLYTIGGFTQSIAANNTNPPGPDISFRNCPQTCPEEWYFTPNQPIQTSTNFQASCCITSESVINPNINVDFRAGYEIVLKPNPNGTAGFYATGHQSGNFHAYIARCDEINKLPEARSKQSKIITENTSNKPDIKIHPNPASTYINIDSGKEKITSWELFDVSGKSILKGTSNQVNVQNLPRTTYLLKINTTSKQVTKKVIVK
ncbi:T9SS type A sorting domain-containing protein [Chryseobacterium gambrini]|uniref:T9SS type A sorting domain-containing protein n=1 Tax=Chryseobacterium gambrini TaxID=373672 RepID=UPI003BA3F967